MLKQDSGYTLVELLLAMAIFSFGLLVIVGGSLSLFDYYQNSIQSRAVQLAARTAINRIVITGNVASWFAYNTNAICLSTGKIFYRDTGTNQLMEGGWDASTAACNSAAAISPSPVTSSDVYISALTPEQADNYGVGNVPTPCATGPCGPPALTSHKSIRVSVRATSDITNAPPAATACPASAPATCVVATLSTTLTAGEF